MDEKHGHLGVKTDELRQTEDLLLPNDQEDQLGRCAARTLPRRLPAQHRVQPRRHVLLPRLHRVPVDDGGQRHVAPAFGAVRAGHLHLPGRCRED